MTATSTASGGIIGGPYGVLGGSLFDIHEVATTDLFPGEISSIWSARISVLAEVPEQSPE